MLLVQLSDLMQFHRRHLENHITIDKEQVQVCLQPSVKNAAYKKFSLKYIGKGKPVDVGRIYLPDRLRLKQADIVRTGFT